MPYVVDVHETPSSRVRSRTLGIACVLVAATTGGYVALLGEQGSLAEFAPRVAFVLTVLVGLTILTGVAAFTDAPARRATLAAACAGGLLPLGFLAAFSIGLPLLGAGSLALLGWRSALRDPRAGRLTGQSGAAALAAVLVLAIGFATT